MQTVANELKAYLTGWKLYFRLATTPKIFGELDGWIRRRLRMVQLKQWKRGSTVFTKLRARGIGEHKAAMTARFTKNWWRASSSAAMMIALPNRYFTETGVPTLAR